MALALSAAEREKDSQVAWLVYWQAEGPWFQLWLLCPSRGREERECGRQRTRGESRDDVGTVVRERSSLAGAVQERRRDKGVSCI